MSQIAYKLAAAAAAVEISEKELRRQIHSGKLRAKMVGRSYRIYDEDLRQFVQNLPDAESA